MEIGDFLSQEDGVLLSRRPTSYFCWL